MMRKKNPRKMNEAHLSFVRELPCLCCGNNIETEAAHIRMTDLRAAKNNAGVGAKPDDCFVVPLCSRHHREQHDVGDEGKFWRSKGIDALFVALALWAATGDNYRGCQIIEANRRRLSEGETIEHAS